MTGRKAALVPPGAGRSIAVGSMGARVTIEPSEPGGEAGRLMRYPPQVRAVWRGVGLNRTTSLWRTR